MDTTRTAAELMRVYFRALDEPDLSLLDDLFTDDAEWRFPGVALTGGAAVKARMEGRLATGLRLQHVISKLLFQDDTAMCELRSHNALGGQVAEVSGAVICEARGGRIARLVAYPDAIEVQAYSTAIAAALARS